MKKIYDYLNVLINVDRFYGTESLKAFINSCLPHPSEDYNCVNLREYKAISVKEQDMVKDWIYKQSKFHSEDPIPQTANEIISEIEIAVYAFRAAKNARMAAELCIDAIKIAY